MFISQAYAASSIVNEAMNFVPLLVIFLLFFVLIIRPQMKQAKAHRAMLETLKKGDEVLTSAGIMGKIVKVSEASVILEIAPETEVLLQKSAVQSLLENGTLKKNL